ncbi:MAG: hypothetical protein GX859_02500 [Corynebacterium humireducens]|jgi:hypothetical protein|uniref:Uncharacterized protein n=2 Tax=Corynebacterium humireducens TaxID=1223514 RepID=A0A0B5D8P5_9CORY|nr:hypothetical protein [Corynebacterium humireducens]AJE32149.1 hypothetical protein B842_01465 [Corynebacterium humireducens NBRC 106098 = DSM 45392]NLA55160.1 hypothetical protein [Corynebacterium humireducens]
MTDATDTTGTTGTTGTDKKPETVRLMLLLFAVAVGGEIIHQILNVTIGFMDPSALIATAKEAMSEEQLAEITDGRLRATVIASMLLAGGFGIAVMGLLAFMLVLIHRRSSYAGLARRMLLVFGFYFGFRILMLFMASPGGNNVPVAMYLLDGSVQILVGVAAVLGLVFSLRVETLKWTREIDASGKRIDPRRK